MRAAFRPSLAALSIAGVVLATGLAACGPGATTKTPAAAEKAAPDGPLIPAEVLSKLGRNIDDVTLVDRNGASVAWKDLNGAPRVVFFGFTHCPEICPSTIAALQAAQAEAGPGAAPMRIDFVSIDPARDTPAALSSYFSSFGPNVRGLTGTDEAIAKVAKAFRASYRKSDLGGGDYTMDHTTMVYLLDANGAVVDVATHDGPPERLAAQIKALTSARAGG